MTPVFCKGLNCHKALLKPDSGGVGFVIICDTIVVINGKIIGTCKKCRTKAELPLEIRLESGILG